MVQRYLLQGGLIEPHNEGDWVSYEDYAELERKLRVGYDHRMQEAINLFYHDDFYLARNLFSMLLRACPEDGIIRWYLFACEHFFHQEGEFEVDYSLFGIREL